ncbi:MAG: hypothetical protein NC237_09280, partial [Eubacterium sp.]|nr:hypothetical protein [Eubacterium sp.]
VPKLWADSRRFPAAHLGRPDTASLRAPGSLAVNTAFSASRRVGLAARRKNSKFFQKKLKF